MKKQLIVATTIALLMGCTKQKSIEGVEVIPFDMEHAKVMDEVVTKVEYLALDAPLENFVSGVSRIERVGDMLLIQESKVPKNIKAFDLQGRFLHQYGRQGNGRGEYLELQCMAHDADYLYAVDSRQYKLYKYNLHTGAYISVVPLAFNVVDMVKLDNGDFMLFTPYLQPGGTVVVGNEGLVGMQEPYRVMVIDSMLNVKDKLLAYKEGEYNHFGELSRLAVQNDTITLQCHFEPMVYLFDKQNGAQLAAYNLDLGGDAIPSGEYGYSVINESSWTYLFSSLYRSGQYLMGTINIRNKEWNAFVLDYSTGELYFNSSSAYVKEKNPLAWCEMLPICGVVDGKAVGCIRDYHTYKFMVTNGFQAASTYIEQYLEDGNPVLVFYSLR